PYPKFTEVDGFLKDKSGRLFLKDEKTQVFEHKTHPVKGIYYDEQHGLYQHGEPYPKFTEVDGFLKDKSGRLFLKDEKTQVFEHQNHPVKDVYYDEQHGLYQHGEPYVPATVAKAVNLATDSEIAALLNSESNYDELVKAAAAGELVLEYDDEDLDSFTAEQFVNID
ncbi:hypothetical protein ACGFMK_48070, partial [Amycolatopsis sp. NPDC049252]|uniref:hypothetical protein n=1 Tax=Amycolatopsis sp. NPDC049252 TaxID=3363933 RepID=UPI00371A4190